MRWDRDHESPDVIDRRGERSGGNLAGLLPFLPLLFRSRFGWLILLVAGGYYAYQYFGGGVPQSAHGARTDVSAEGRAETEEVHFVSFVLDDAQATWSRQFAARGAGTYRHAKLVLFTDATQTGCGFGRAATGPFYCPSDERVYIDLGFFKQLAQRLGARGQFAQAYVVAHELGHHVQKLLGTTDRVSRLHGNTEGATGASVRLELQADCLAGMWAHSTAQRNLLESSDIDQALGATAAIGDDRLQREATGTVRPETWTHGSSAQRGKWFRRGYDAGKMEACDTFAAGSL